MPRIEVLAPGYAFTTNVGTPAFCSVILVEGEKRLLFDTAHVGRRAYLQAQLAHRGLSAADIDIQVLSHAHWDHVQNIDLFAGAPLLLHRLERKYALDPHDNDWATPKWTGAVLESHRQIVEVGESYQVMAGCRVIELAGHSPGSIGLEVETDEGLCLIVGDAIHHAGVARAERAPLVFWDQRAADASIRRCLDSGALIYPGHDRPFRIRDGEVLYAADFQLTIDGIGPETSGLSFIASPPPDEPWIMPGIEEQRARLQHRA